MELRINHFKSNPAVYDSMIQLEKSVQEMGIDDILYELIKIRASQINGCSFCLDMHSKDFLKKGQDVERLIQIPVWRESNLFTEKEKATLELTEAVTQIQNGLSDKIYEHVRKQFDEKEFMTLIMAINAINAWNRIGISVTMYPNCFTK